MSLWQPAAFLEGSGNSHNRGKKQTGKIFVFLFCFPILCFLSYCRTFPYLLPSAGSSPGCHSSLNSCDNLQHRVCAGGSLPYATVSCQWASEAVTRATLSKSCCCVSLKASPDAPAFPQDKALPRLSVLLGCSWCTGIAVLLSDLAGVWAGVFFHVKCLS